MCGRWTWAAVLWVVLGPAVAQASPVGLFGFGPRSQGMVGAGAAAGRGIDATYANPALLGDARSKRLYAGWQVAHFQLAARGASQPFEQRPSPSYVLGAVLPLPLHGPLAQRLALGFGAVLPRDVITRVRMLYPERPQFPLLAPRVPNLNFKLGLGARLGHGVSLGAGVQVSAGLVGQIDVETGRDGQVQTYVEDELISSFAPVLGAAWQVHSAVRAGVTYRGRLQSKYDMQLVISDLDVPFPPVTIMLPRLYVTGIARMDPAQLQAEVSWRLARAQLVLGLTVRRWGSFGGWLGATVRCPSEQPDCDALSAPQAEFSNTVTPRVGLAYDLGQTPWVRGELRAGYAYEASPLRAQTASSNLWDNPRHVFGVGYGLELRRGVPLRLEFALQEHVLVAREHRKAADVANDNPGYPGVRTLGHMLLFALGMGLDF